MLGEMGYIFLCWNLLVACFVNYESKMTKKLKVYSGNKLLQLRNSKNKLEQKTKRLWQKHMVKVKISWHKFKTFGAV